MQEMKQQTHSRFIEVVGWECLFFVAAAIRGPSVSNYYGDLVNELNVCP